MRLFACLCLAGFLLGQSTAFEAADVHTSAKAQFPYMRGPSAHGDHYAIRDANLVDLISAAYGVTDEKVVEGPSWLEQDRFDVIAKMPPGSTPEAQEAMLQSLLADRFKLVVHHDTRPIPAFALTVAAKHPALKPSDGSGDTGCKFVPDKTVRVPNEPFVPMIGYDCHNMTMKAFSEGLPGMNAFIYINQNPIVNQTGLEGAWDFSFKFTGRMAPKGTQITLFDGLEKIGLKLAPAKVPMPVIVVDRLNRKPTENAPGIADILHEPPIPTEFEVAEVKPSEPGSNRMMFQFQRGGRVNVVGMTLKFLVQYAWQLTDDTMAGAPKWFDSDHYDIVAKAPSEGADTGVDSYSIMPMLRALLKERFKLAAHMEDRPVPAYTLVAVKPKLKQADPKSRTKFQEGPGPDGKDPRIANPMLARLVYCQNMTMAQFAEQLQSIAGGYIHSPVMDATKLEGSYDFTLSFSPSGMGAGGRGGQPSAAGEASDPNGAMTLFEAVERQLGLKLVMEKRNLPVLVIDHIEQKPIDN